MSTTKQVGLTWLWFDALVLLSSVGLLSWAVLAVIDYENRQTDRIKMVETKCNAALPFDAVFMADSISRHTSQIKKLQGLSEKNRKWIVDLRGRVDNVEVIQASRATRIENLENQMQNNNQPDYRRVWPGVRKGQ